MGIKIEDLPIELSAGELLTRYVELGELAIRHAQVPAGTDLGPVLQGLPHDRCPSPHWGIMLAGAFEVEYADGSCEVTRAGEVFYWPAGHTAIAHEDALFVEVGPVGPMREVGEHAQRVLAQA